jgi:glycosyltransferase involved in cell wall biosynthesis
MVVKNQLWNDARVKKEACSLSNAGYDVCIISAKEDGFPSTSTWRGIQINRIRKDSKRREDLRKKVLDYCERSADSLWSKILMTFRKNKLRRYLTDLKRDILYEYKFIQAAISVEANIYHAHDLDTLLICAAAAEMQGAKLVYDSHELWLETTRYSTYLPYERKLWCRLIERYCIRKTCAVIAVTPLRGQVMRRMYPDLRRLVIIENTVESVSDLPLNGKLRENLGLKESQIIALYQGVLCPERGLEELLQASYMLRDTGIAVVLMGHGSFKRKLLWISDQLGIEGTVFFHPPVPSEEMLQLTVSADMGLILFRNTCMNNYYSLPNKLYEYMMAGIPVIASNFPEIATVIRETDSGILVDPESPEEIASAIRTLAANPEEAKRKGARGRMAALEKHNWSNEEVKLLNLYRDISNE